MYKTFVDRCVAGSIALLAISTSSVLVIAVAPTIGHSISLPPVPITGQRPPRDEQAIQDFLDELQRLTDAALMREAERNNQLESTQIAGADNRQTPECKQEAEAMTGLLASASSSAVRSGQADPVNSSRLIMSNPIGDPRFSGDPAWEKWEFKADWYVRSSATGAVVDRGMVIIHFMFNTRTRQAVDFKFKNSVTQGCGQGLV